MVQFEIGSVVRFVETDLEVARMVFQYTKAVAERPFKYVNQSVTESYFASSGHTIGWHNKHGGPAVQCSHHFSQLSSLPVGRVNL